jgi:transposase-like protein
MSRSVRMSPPSGTMQMEMLHARQAMDGHPYYMMKCPYCHRSAIRIFEDTRGHIQIKCKTCRKETIFNVTRTGKDEQTHKN